VLSQDEIAAFVRDGYVALRGAVPARTVAECQQVIWSELAAQGVLRDDESTWAAPVVRITCPEGGPFVAAGTTPAVMEACDQLIGPGRWWRRQGVGGSIPVRFPSEDDPGDAGWHIEASYDHGGEPWVNVGTRGRGLLAIYLLTDVDERSAPTRVRPGSHLDVPPLLAPAGPDGAPWLQSAERAAAATAHRPVELATGAAGDVFLCHPFLVHAATWPHRGRSPRMIAQPAVALHSEYPLEWPADGEPPPVQRAILTALGRAA
jgi:phytanoyl-CoA dioxygenase PhyH